VEIMSEQRADVSETIPAHHRPGGGFRNPWPGVEVHGFADFLKWKLGGRNGRPAPNEPRDIHGTLAPRATPSFATPRASSDELTATWVGHATFLLQIGSINVLTDPMWSERASPLRFAGPRRLAPPAFALESLPPIDVVLMSHDHYDHFDDATIRSLTRAHPRATWLAPLEVAAQLARRGARLVRELDWWNSTTVVGVDGGATLEATCVPAQHFSGRRLGNRNSTLWCGWVVRAGDRAVYFAGDTALHPEFAEIARRCAPLDLALLPIGAYEPRWFMGSVHMNPEDALAAYQALLQDGNGGCDCVLGGTHFGTFKLTDEPLDEPPRRMRAAWTGAGLDARRLWVPALGETWRRRS
jgi:N-acyl-phosphatidylethanolamine-hydrolysing phospholipase D